VYCDKTTEVRVTRFHKSIVKSTCSMVRLTAKFEGGPLDRGLKPGWENFVEMRVSLESTCMYGSRVLLATYTARPTLSVCIDT